MRTARFTCLLFASAALLAAQTATVQNAALYQESQIYYSVLSFVSGLSSAFFEAVVYAPASNVISPRMLAVLSYPLPLPNPFYYSLPQPVNATLYIRPVGSSTLIPVSNIASAVTGTVTFVVPADVPTGGAELLYQVDGGATQWTNVNVVQSSFALFRNGVGGPAIAQAIPSSGPGFAVGLATPIQPGQTLGLTGSGLGYGTTVTATIGGVSAPLIYAGPSATAPAGNDQILLQVPPGVADSCYVPVVVTFNQNSVSTTISETSDGSPCKHPWQLSVNDLQMLDRGGSLTDAMLNLSTQLSVVTPAAGSRGESANLYISTISASQLAGYFGPAPVANGCQPPVATGVVEVLNGSFAVIGTSTGPDIGSTVTLDTPTTTIQLTNTNGPFASNLPPPTDGPLSNLPVPAIAGGKWTFQSSGGADLGPSSFGFTLPAPVQLTGGVPVMITHTHDETLTWNGSAFDSGATAVVSLQGSGFVSCIVPASAGTVTIPAAMLSAFGANTIGTLTISISEAGAYLPHTLFQTTGGSTLLTSRGGTLVVFVPFSSSDSRPVFIQ